MDALSKNNIVYIFFLVSISSRLMRLEELTGSWFADPNGGDNVPLYGGLQEFLP